MEEASKLSRQRLLAFLAATTPSSRRHRALAAVALVGLGAFAATKCSQTKAKQAKAKRAASRPAPGAAQGLARKAGGRRPSGQALKSLLPLLLRVAGRKVVLLAVLAIARTALSNRLARLQGYLFRAAFLRRVPLFARNLAENVALCAVAGALEASAGAAVALLELQWRRLLTRRLHADYFEDMAYYKLSHVDRRIDSPEQRICEEVPKLCSGLAELTRELIVATVDVGFYAWQLRQYSGTHRYTAATLAYVVGAGAFTTSAAPNFGRMFKRQQELDGSYRHLHSRLRASAESVAFYRGIEREGLGLRAAFRSVVQHNSRVLSAQWKFGMVQDFLLKYLGATVAVALIIGPFFGGRMRPEATVAGRAQMLSNMRYHTSVIISLFSAMGTLGTSSRKFMKLGAYADRVQEMQRVLREIRAGTGPRGSAATGALGNFAACNDAIVFEGATVVTPADVTLVKELSLHVPAGTNLLVTGPNGAGKSSLFRVLGGLWPLTHGRISKPGGGGTTDGLSHEIFYVPQRPYVTTGTLQEQLLYPLTPDGDHRIPDAELRALLDSVDLGHLLTRDEAGDVDWAEALSLGEQQRLGMARLFYHRPRFAILDECTSGVTVDMEERFCEMVKAMGCTCITISHRPALMAFHDVVLALDGEGGWDVHPGHRSAAPAAANGLAKPLPALEPAAAKGEGHGKKRRAKDAAAVTRGMAALPAGEEELGDGNEGFAEAVVARAPPDAGGLHHLWAPRMELTPARLSPLARWKHTSTSTIGLQSVCGLLLGGDARQSTLGLATVGGVVMLRTLLQDRIASLNGRSVDLVLRQDLNGFIRLIGVSVLQSMASAVLAPSLRHLADMLALRWRAALTHAAFKRYLAGNCAYTTTHLAGMQDADQRLSRDMERLAAELAALIPSLAKPLVDVAWFSARLWALTGLRGSAVLWLYTVLGYGCLRVVTPDFGAMLAREHALEGGLRGAHSRLRTHAESVAFFGGGAKEGSVIAARFDALNAHLSSLVRARWAYGAADEFFAKQLPHNVTWLLTLLYALDQKGDFSDTAFQGALVHRMRYMASVVTQCFSGFGELLAMPKRLAEISGGITRVGELLEVLDKSTRLDDNIARQLHEAAARSPGSDIRFDKLQVLTPAGKLLARQLSVVASPGKSLLVTGPNGSGKTSLLRLLGGLWPLPPDGGEISRPVDGKHGAEAIYYVPQRPYATSGTLRDQLLYPLTREQALRGWRPERHGGAPASAEALDAELDGLMGVVRLGYLVEREGGWGAVREWGETLSLGEQQRIGMARLFFHRPSFGVLDECTNATSVDVEQALYEHAAALGITLVTISQRTALVRFHAAELRLLDGAGNWELRSIRTLRAPRPST